MKQLITTTLPLLLVAALLATGCTGSKGTVDIPQEELDELKAKEKSAAARLAVAKKEAKHIFQTGLGDLWYWRPDDALVPSKNLISSANFKIGRKLKTIATFEAMNNAFKMFLYKDGDKTKKKGATGALAAFFYPLTDAFMDETNTGKQLYVSLTRIILQCKEALAPLVEKPENYASNKVDEILAEHQQKMTQAPELVIDTSGSEPVLQEKSGGTPQDYYQVPEVQQAYEAFKKEVKRLQKNYEIVMGLQPPEQS